MSKQQVTSDGIAQVPAMNWIVGPWDDNWLPVQSAIRLRRVKRLTFEFFLPETPNSRPKSLKILLGDDPVAVRRISRGTATEVTVEFHEPKSGFLMLDFSDPENVVNDARQLGAVCVREFSEPEAVDKDALDTEAKSAEPHPKTGAHDLDEAFGEEDLFVLDPSKLVDESRLQALRLSGLMDENWYLQKYPDVRECGLTPTQHYAFVGAKLERQPGPDFDPAFYLATNADVRKAKLDPLIHYVRHGRAENRKAVPPGDETLQRFTATGIQRVGGRQLRRADRRTVLLCAHIVGNELFGSERSLLDMQDALIELGYNVVVTVPSLRNSDYIRLLSSKSVAVYALDYCWWRDSFEPSEAAIARFARIMADEKVDVVHANTIMLREPLIAAGRLGILRILHARELIRNDEALTNYIGLPANEIVRKVWDNTEVLIANSRATADCFTSEGRRISLVYNTADFAELTTVPSPFTGGTLRVGLISSNVAKKGLEDFALVAKRVTERVPNVRFRLIGPRNAETEKIEKRIKAGKLPSSLELPGYFNTPAEALAEVDLVLSLSKFDESFGRTVLEAMAAARPVIVYDRAAPRELVIDDRTGFVVPADDVDAVAAKVIELAADRRRAMLMGVEGQERAIRLFGKKAYFEAMRDAYALLDSTVVTELSQRSILRRRTETPQLAPEDLKLAYFCWHFPVPSETFVLNELRILKSRGIDVIVFCRQSPFNDFKPDFDIEWRKVTDVDSFVRGLVETGRNMVHAHFIYPTVTDMVWPACEMAGIPFTCIVHAQDVFRWKNAVNCRVDEFARSPYCRQIFTLSHFHRDFLINRDVPPEKITINSNCVDPDLFVDGRIPDRAARKSRRICAVARFAPKKGLDRLILAAKALEADGIEVDLYGYGELEAEFEKLIRDRGIRNVHIRGPVKSRDELLAVFRQHDLFVCPSVRAVDGDMDGLPTTILESISAHLPVLSTDISGIRDLIVDKVTGLVCEATPRSIAQKVREFYALPAQMVENFLEDAEVRLRLNHDGAFLVNTLLRFWQNKTIDIGLVTWNNSLQLKEILGRLFKYTELPFHLVICDNGSGPEALAELLKFYSEHDNMTIVLNRKNSFVGPGTNICLELGESDYFIYVCGKEGIVTKYGWEKSFVRTFDNNPRFGQIGTLGYSPSYLYGRDYPNAIELFPSFRNTSFAIDNPDREFRHVQGGFFGVRRAMVNQIGGFSEKVPHSYTDVEFSYFVESMGWELGEVPELMALFNKTRPGLGHRVDDTHAALHPPLMTDLDRLGRIATRSVHHCNICAGQVPIDQAEQDRARCRECGADPRARSIFRTLAESTLLYRRLPALGVGVPDALQGLWRQQFQGVIRTVDALTEELRASGKLDNRTAGMQMALINELPEAVSDLDLIFREVVRILMPGASLLLGGAVGDAAFNALRGRPFRLTRKARFSAATTSFDHLPIYVFQRTVDGASYV